MHELISAIISSIILSYIYDKIKKDYKFTSSKNTNEIIKKYRFYPKLIAYFFCALFITLFIFAAFLSKSNAVRFIFLLSSGTIFLLGISTIGIIILCKLIKKWELKEFYIALSCAVEISPQKLKQTLHIGLIVLFFTMCISLWGVFVMKREATAEAKQAKKPPISKQLKNSAGGANSLGSDGM